jgi:hypothetical protein
MTRNKFRPSIPLVPRNIRDNLRICLFMNGNIFKKSHSKKSFRGFVPVLTSMEFKIPIDIQEMQGRQQGNRQNAGRLEKQDTETQTEMIHEAIN